MHKCKWMYDDGYMKPVYVWLLLELFRRHYFIWRCAIQRLSFCIAFICPHWWMFTRKFYHFQLVLQLPNFLESQSKYFRKFRLFNLIMKIFEIFIKSNRILLNIAKKRVRNNTFVLYLSTLYIHFEGRLLCVEHDI